MMPTSKKRIAGAIQKLRESNSDICPSTIAYELKVFTKEITAYLRTQDDVYLKQKAHVYPSSTQNIYYPSIWGFKDKVNV